MTSRQNTHSSLPKGQTRRLTAPPPPQGLDGNPCNPRVVGGFRGKCCMCRRGAKRAGCCGVATATFVIGSAYATDTCLGSSPKGAVQQQRVMDDLGLRSRIFPEAQNLRPKIAFRTNLPSSLSAAKPWQQSSFDAHLHPSRIKHSSGCLNIKNNASLRAAHFFERSFCLAGA